MTFNNWQDWAVAFIVAFCMLRIGIGIFRACRQMAGKEYRNSPCAGCTASCDVKRLYEEKRSNCAEEKKKKIKKSCCC